MIGTASSGDRHPDRRGPAGGETRRRATLLRRGDPGGTARDAEAFVAPEPLRHVRPDDPGLQHRGTARAASVPRARLPLSARPRAPVRALLFVYPSRSNGYAT